MISAKKEVVLFLVSLFVLSLLLPTVNSSIFGFSNGSFVIKLQSSSYELERLDSGETEIKMKDFSNFTYPGEPALPSKIYKILLPPMSTLKSIEIADISKEDLGFGYKIVIAPFPASDNGEVTYNESDVDWSVIKSLGVKDLRKWRFVEIRFLPFEYSESDGHLIFIKDITLKINFERNLNVSNQLLNDTVMDDLIDDIFVNRDSAKELGYPNTLPSASPQTYLIVTTASVQSSGVLNNFINFKQSQGYNVQTITIESTSIQGQIGRDLPEKLRNYLKSIYLTNSVKYVLLIGSMGTIPMRYCYPKPSNHVDDSDPLKDGRVPTDHYYADLTGDWDSDGDGYFGEYGEDNFDLNPEVIVGRIPFDDSNTVSSILQRIMNFSQDNGSWKKNILLLGAIENFQNEDSTG
ncbi:MAG: C25 family cysteine peptidase, partial [Nitrososphaeria archaeon]